MERRNSLSRFFDVIGGVENVVLAIMVVGMIFTILVQIIGRVIGHPFPWTEETSRLSLSVDDVCSAGGRL